MTDCLVGVSSDHYDLGLGLDLVSWVRYGDVILGRSGVIIAVMMAVVLPVGFLASCYCSFWLFCCYCCSLEEEKVIVDLHASLALMEIHEKLLRTHCNRPCSLIWNPGACPHWPILLHLASPGCPAWQPCWPRDRISTFIGYRTNRCRWIVFFAIFGRFNSSLLATKLLFLSNLGVPVGIGGI